MLSLDEQAAEHKRAKEQEAKIAAVLAAPIIAQRTSDPASAVQVWSEIRDLLAKQRGR